MRQSSEVKPGVVVSGIWRRVIGAFGCERVAFDPKFREDPTTLVLMAYATCAGNFEGQCGNVVQQCDIAFTAGQTFAAFS